MSTTTPQVLDADLDRLLSDPARWAELFTQFCGYPTFESVLPKLATAFRKADEDTWRTLWTTGFPSQLARHITSKLCCGYTREDLTSSIGEEDGFSLEIEIISWSLRMFVECVSRLPEAPDHEQRSILDILQYQIPILWGDLWDIRAPLLDSANALVDGHGSLLHAAVIALAKSVESALRHYRNIASTPTSSRMVHVMLLIWIYSEDRVLRADALACASLALVGHSCEQIQYVVDNSCTSRAHITEAVLRDFRDEQVLDRHLNASVQCIQVLWPNPAKKPPQLETPNELKLVPGILAAVRRQLCMGNRKLSNSAVEGVFDFLTVLVLRQREAYRPVFSKSLAHAVLDLFSNVLLDFMQLEHVDETITDFLADLVAWCAERLRAGTANGCGPQTQAMRCYSRKAWQMTVDEINSKRLARQSSRWHRFLILWKQLGNIVPNPYTSDAVVPAAFQVLQRCSWNECMCSVHKPAHRLKLCKGCWVVAYCSVDCQTSDWERGGHKENCRKHTE